MVQNSPVSFMGFMWLAAGLSLVGCAGANQDRPPGSTTAPLAHAQDPASAADSPPAASPRTLSDADTKERIAPHLAPGETIAHPVLAGSFGPGHDTAAVIVDRGGTVAGFAVVTRAGGTRERVPFPDIANGMLDRVIALLLVDADARAGHELVIMTEQMTGIGPEGAIPQPFHAVITWDGRAFVRLEDAEAAIYDKSTEAEVRRILEQRARP